jgi:tRNA threonylcarbamoyladenosine biosynthesis protein TsaB
MILALDTSSDYVCVAVGDAHGVRYWQTSNQRMRHAELLAPTVSEGLKESGVTPAELTLIVAGVGPGPFTGLRVGLVTAKTLGHVLSIPVTGICSLDALAFQVTQSGAAHGGFGVATDARRKEVYFATYNRDGVRVSGPRVEKPEVVATELPTAGAGALLYPESFPHPLEPAVADPSTLIQIALGRTSVELLAEATPLYLRRPDAQTPGKPKAVS